MYRPEGGVAVVVTTSYPLHKRAATVFLATDTDRARLLRPYLGRNTTVIATSQVYSGPPASDAYRVALEMMRGRAAFDLDGVTGRLRVGVGVIEREPIQAEYRDGQVSAIK